MLRWVDNGAVDCELPKKRQPYANFILLLLLFCSVFASFSVAVAVRLCWHLGESANSSNSALEMCKYQPVGSQVASAPPCAIYHIPSQKSPILHPTSTSSISHYHLEHATAVFSVFNGWFSGGVESGKVGRVLWHGVPKSNNICRNYTSTQLYLCLFIYTHTGTHKLQAMSSDQQWTWDLRLATMKTAIPTLIRPVSPLSLPHFCVRKYFIISRHFRTFRPTNALAKGSSKLSDHLGIYIVISLINLESHDEQNVWYLKVSIRCL